MVKKKFANKTWLFAFAILIHMNNGDTIFVGNNISTINLSAKKQYIWRESYTLLCFYQL